MPLPREHGAWVMLLLSILTGWLAGRIHDPVAAVAATLAAAGGFLAQAAWMEWRTGKASFRWFAVESALAGAMGIEAMSRGGSRVVAVAVATGTAATLAFLFRIVSANPAGRVSLKAWTAHLWAAGAMGGVAVWIAVAGGSRTDSVELWFSLSANFAAGILLVRAVRAGTPRSHLWLVAWSLLCGIVWAWLGAAAKPAVFLLWLPIPLRWMVSRGWIPVRTGWRELGLLESALGIWTMAWTIAALG